MNASPESTMILRELKDFDQFLSSGTKTREVLQGSSRRLNFSGAGEDISLLEESRISQGFSSRKRHLDSLVGFDVTKKFREKESEVVSTQAEVVRLERLLQEAEVQHKKAQLEKDTEMEILRCKQRRDKELIDDLQHKLKKSQAHVRESEDAVDRASARSSTSSLDTQAKMVKMQRDHLQLCDQLRQEMGRLRDKVLILEKEAGEKDVKVAAAESHLEDVESELREVRKKAVKVSTTQQDADTLKLQLDQTRARVKELEARLEDASEMEGRVSLFETTVRKLPGLERELIKLKQDNKFLRDTALNAKLLEEKLGGSQQEITQLKQRCQNAASLQAQLDACKTNMARFEALGQEELELSRAVTPEDLRCYLGKLQRGDQSLSDTVDQLRASLQSHKESREVSEGEVRRLRSKLEQEQRNTQQNAHLVKRLQRKLTLVIMERDGLKNVLTSYEAEITINHSAVSQERTRSLEEQLKLYQRELQHLEEGLEAAGQNSKATTSLQSQKSDVEKVKRLEERVHEREGKLKVLEEKEKEREEKIKELEKRMDEREKRIKKMEGEKEVLELRLETRALKGDYDPTKTKILHFKDNPLAHAVEVRRTEIERLQEENKELYERVLLLEAGETQNLTQRVGHNLAQSAHPDKELTDLQENVKSLESRNKRMMEAFKRKSMEMREVVYRLTGYRVDTSGNNQYKLIPIYAESPDDYLLFEQTRSKELQLLETDFSGNLEYLIDAYLRHENSYPAFLSAVTMELFNRQAGYPPSSHTQEVEEEEEEEEEEEGEGEGEEEEEEEDDDDDDDEEEERGDGMETSGDDSGEVQEVDNNNEDDEDLVILD